MKNKVKQFLGIVFLISLLVSYTSPALAFGGTGAHAVTDGTAIWKVESKNYNGYKYGDWVDGPSFWGPNAHPTWTFSRTVSNSISGEYTSKKDISNAVGFSVEYSTSVTESLTYDAVGSGHYIMRARPRYKQYTVTQRKYNRLDGKDYRTSETKTCIVKQYSGIDYRMFTL